MNIEDIKTNEAPLLALEPGASLLAPSKPLVEMTDAELSEWHSRHRDHKNPQTFAMHLRSLGSLESGKSKAVKKQPDVSEFI